MNPSNMYLHDIGRLTENLSGEFGSLPYEKFSEDTNKIESAVRRFVIMQERWRMLKDDQQRQLGPMNWPALTGRWDREAKKRSGVSIPKYSQFKYKSSRAARKPLHGGASGISSSPDLTPNARDYISLLNDHTEKENNVLFVMADSRLSEEIQDRLFEGFEKIEEERIGIGKHEGLHRLLRKLSGIYRPETGI